ncbi:MAG: radical SAM protein, partial [Phoenicibacter congonensis]|nr:radical SAM protein [Phoenicibacter congonensis]
LPIQCGSNKVLKDMNRKYTREQYMELVYKLKSVRPDIALSTDIIVGFPTETEEDFEATMEAVREVKYASAFTFIYSKRKGTPAAKMENCSTKEEIQDRFERLADLVADCAHDFNEPYAGKAVKALIEGTSKKDENILRGVSAHSQVVHAPIEPGKTVNDYLGKIIDVKVDEAKTWYLKGSII